MKRIAWLTDIHLNFVSSEQCEAFHQEVASLGPDAVLLGGDIGEAGTFWQYLEEFAESLQVPIYFVLGNHDYYRGSIRRVRAAAELLSEESPYLHWLPFEGVVELSPETALLSHGGWGDARLGDFLGSEIILNDYVLIGGLAEPDDLLEGTFTSDKRELQQRLNHLGDEAAEHFRRLLPTALQRYERILVLTHVPPFREAAWYEGRISGDHWLPHCTCAAAGQVLLKSMREHPDRAMTVLCGHTHGGGESHVLGNLHGQ